MKTIQLTQGYVAQVSDGDFERVRQYKWCAQVARHPDGSIKNVYAVRGVRRADGTCTTQNLHRFILDVTDQKVQVDHAPDQSGLNCTRENLRLATHAENQHNQRLRINNSSGVKGVYWHKATQKWYAQIRVNGKRKYIGIFTSLADAKQAYDSAAQTFHKKFASTNKMLEAA